MTVAGSPGPARVTLSRVGHEFASDRGPVRALELVDTTIDGGAFVTLAGPSGDRTMPLADFFVAYRKTAMVRGEIVRRVTIPRAPATASGGTPNSPSQ